MAGQPRHRERFNCGCLYAYDAARVTADSLVPIDFETGHHLLRARKLIFAIDSNWPRVKVCDMHAPAKAPADESV